MSSELYTKFPFLANINTSYLLILVVICLVLIVGLFFLFRKKSKFSVINHISSTEVLNVKTPEMVTPKISFSERVRAGLSRSRQEVWGKALALFGSGVSTEVLEQFEELLYSSDIGPQMTGEIIAAITHQNAIEKLDSEDKVKKFLYDFLYKKMEMAQNKISSSLYSFSESENLKVIMIVSVNGAGKTTTIGKLATKLKRQGAKVVVGACDTFRAAAVDQLQVWCDRAGVQMVRANEGTNPTGVAYSALQLAQQENANYCLLDTAGRLHTKENLMEELSKTKRVLAKPDQNAPHEVLLVLDAITGQNALKQAEEFHRYLNLTGLIFTKCDGSSKAGSAVKIVNDLQVPISFIGVGEDIDDLDKFDLDVYLRGLLSIADS